MLRSAQVTPAGVGKNTIPLSASVDGMCRPVKSCSVWTAASVACHCLGPSAARESSSGRKQHLFRSRICRASGRNRCRVGVSRMSASSLVETSMQTALVRLRDSSGTVRYAGNE